MPYFIASDRACVSSCVSVWLWLFSVLTMMPHACSLNSLPCAVMICSTKQNTSAWLYTMPTWLSAVSACCGLYSLILSNSHNRNCCTSLGSTTASPNGSDSCVCIWSVESHRCLPMMLNARDNSSMDELMASFDNVGLSICSIACVASMYVSHTAFMWSDCGPSGTRCVVMLASISSNSHVTPNMMRSVIGLDITNMLSSPTAAGCFVSICDRANDCRLLIKHTTSSVSHPSHVRNMALTR